jgi:type I restriction enzyme, S subunit
MSNDGWTSGVVGDCLVPLSLASKAKIATRNYQRSGRFPVIDQGQNKIAAWTDDQNAVIDSHLPLIVFGDHTRILKYVDFPFARGADGTQLLKPIDGIDPLFFYYVCRAIDLPKRGYNRHFGILREKSISYPVNKQEQARIGSTLRAIENAIDVQSELVTLSYKIKKAAMRELFTRGLRGEAQKETEIGPIPESWHVATFSEVREWLQYGTSIRCTSTPATYPVLRIPNVEAGRVNAADLKYCDLPQSQADKYLLAEGDLLFIRTNGVLNRLGCTAVYCGKPERALFASYLIRARLKRHINSRYAAFFYGSEVGTALVAGRATPASDGKYNLNTGTIDSLLLPLPPTTEEQLEIVSALDAIERKIDLHEQKKLLLEGLFSALLHSLITGEICVSDLDLSAIESKREAVAA